jgi:hypothetical protein
MPPRGIDIAPSTAIGRSRLESLGVSIHAHVRGQFLHAGGR